MSNFDELVVELDELAELRKAQTANPDEDQLGDEDEDEGADAALGKSFSLKLENGEDLEAVDGTELVKSLISRLDDADTTLMERDEALQKALRVSIDMIKGQADDIADLKKQIKAIGSTGVGRKATVTIAEKPEVGVLQKAEEGMSGLEFLAKAEGAMMSGKITGHELALAESALNRGAQVRPDIVSRVVG